MKNGESGKRCRRCLRPNRDRARSVSGHTPPSHLVARSRRPYLPPSSSLPRHRCRASGQPRAFVNLDPSSLVRDGFNLTLTVDGTSGLGRLPTPRCDSGLLLRAENTDRGKLPGLRPGVGSHQFSPSRPLTPDQNRAERRGPDRKCPSHDGHAV